MSPRITVCGLGPGGRDRLTSATLDAIERCSVRFVRTARHPTADLVADAETFDDLYESATTFDEVYAAIVERLVRAADEIGEHGEVLYAVPGSPLVLESSVRLLRGDPRVELDVLPAVSFLDEAWARLGVDPVDDGVRLVDGHRFATQAAGERGPLLVAHVHADWVLSDIKLAIDAGPEQTAIVLQRLGTEHEQVFEVPWPELDRVVDADHLTSLYLPEVAAPVAAELMASVELMRRLRRDCPWDQAQDHSTLKPYLVEETYEVLEAIEGVERALDDPTELSPGEAYLHLEEELGDLWFQVLFHAELATEAGQFTVADVARNLHDKLVGRHPHVFGDVPRADTDEPEDTAVIEARWEEIKKAEKARTSAMDGVPAALPALALAAKYLSRASRAGVETELGPLGPALRRLLGEEVGGSAPTPIDGQPLGRALLALVELARRDDIDAEDALRSAATTAARRFRELEASNDGPMDSWALG